MCSEINKDKNRVISSEISSITYVSILAEDIFLSHGIVHNVSNVVMNQSDVNSLSYQSVVPP